MSGPKPITGSKLNYYGAPLSAWRQAAMNAHRALLANPNDTEAQQQLQDSQTVLREHVRTISALNQGANQREMANAADQGYADQASPFHAAILNTADAMSLGAGDEIAGLGAVLPGGMSPQQARDRYRAGLGQLSEDQPLASLGGQVFGAGLLGAAALQNFPGAAARIAAGGTLAGSELAAMGTAAGVAGTEGVARGLLSEGNLGQRIENAGTTGATYAATGAIGTGVINRLRVGNRFWGATRKANKQILANQAAASELDLAAKQASVGMNQARERSLTIGADVAEATAPARIATAQARADAIPVQQDLLAARKALSDARVAGIPNQIAAAQARLTAAEARVAAIPGQQAIQDARVAALPEEAALRSARVGAIPVQQELLAARKALSDARVANIPNQIAVAEARVARLEGDAALHASRVAAIPIQQELLAARNALSEARVANIPNQVALAEARVAKLEGDAALHASRVAAIPTRATMLEDQATILKFRADRVRQMQAAGNVSPGSGTRASEAELRTWASRNMAPELVDGFVARAAKTPGSGIAPPAIEPPAPRVEAPNAGQAQAVVGDAQMPGQALHDTAGRPIPGSVLTLRLDPREAARAAYTANLAATGDLEAAKAAASRAASMVRGAAAELPVADPVERGMAMQAVLKAGPSNANREELVRLLETATPQEQQGFLAHVIRTYPAWARVLTGGR